MIYGPPGAQFTAAFPAPPTVTSQEARVHGVPTLNYAAGGPSHQLSVTVTEARSGRTGYAPVTPAYQTLTRAHSHHDLRAHSHHCEPSLAGHAPFSSIVAGVTMGG